MAVAGEQRFISEKHKIQCNMSRNTHKKKLFIFFLLETNCILRTSTQNDTAAGPMTASTQYAITVKNKVFEQVGKDIHSIKL